MSRIRSVPLADFNPELRAMVGAADKSERELHPTSIRAHHPDIAKAYLRFADLLASKHLAIDDSLYAELGCHFSEKEMVELGMFSAMCVGFGRLSATWQMHEDLPERFQVSGDAPVTPWGPGAWTSARPPTPR